MAPPHQPETQVPAYLVAALKRILRPLVRLLIDRQVTLPFVTGLMKEVYVEVAEAEFKTPGKEQTDSRISLLTGVHRKDVRRLRHGEAEEGTVPETVSIGAELIARWTTEKAYRDGRGRPRRLARTGSSRTEPGFDELCAEVCRQDIRPRAVLDELLRIGAVAIERDERIALKRDAFIPEASFEEKVHYLGRNSGDHLAAAVHNLVSEKDPMFDRSAYHGELSEASVKKLRAKAEKLSMSALQKLYDEAAALAEQDQGKPDAVHRITYGIYLYSDEETDA